MVALYNGNIHKQQQLNQRSDRAQNGTNRSQRTHIHFDGLDNVFGALCAEIIARKVERRQRPDRSSAISVRWDAGDSGYSCTYLHLGTAAAMYFAPIPQPLIFNELSGPAWS